MQQHIDAKIAIMAGNRTHQFDIAEVGHEQDDGLIARHIVKQAFGVIGQIKIINLQFARPCSDFIQRTFAEIHEMTETVTQARFGLAGDGGDAGQEIL